MCPSTFLFCTELRYSYCTLSLAARERLYVYEYEYRESLVLVHVDVWLALCQHFMLLSSLHHLPSASRSVCIAACARRPAERETEEEQTVLVTLRSEPVYTVL